MGNTYTQLHIQAVFAVQNRLSLIKAQWEERLHKYLAGIITSFDHKPIIINGMPDHYSKSQLPTLINYVKKQKEHHHKTTFLDEYVLLLKEFGIEYDERYVFHDPNLIVLCGSVAPTALPGCRGAALPGCRGSAAICLMMRMVLPGYRGYAPTSKTMQ